MIVSTSPDGRTIRNDGNLTGAVSNHCRFQLPRTEEPSGTLSVPTKGGAKAIVSTSPDGRTIRNLSRASKQRKTITCFNFPGRKNYPERNRPDHSPQRLPCFNFPGRKNHPERGVRRPGRGRFDPGFNFPGRKNHPERGGWRLRARAWMPCFNFPGRKNHPEPQPSKSYGRLVV